MIPLVDLKAQHRQIADEVARGFAEVLENTSFILGSPVERFEQAFAKASGVRYCVGVANGTDAIELALRAAGVGSGNEVLVPVNSFIATALAVVRAGATPVFVDSDPDYHLIDLARAKTTRRTKAIIPVHLFGQLAPMEQVADFARNHELIVIEDAAQAQLARRNGRTAGSFGLAAATSFYPGKNLGAYGDGGAVLTDSDAVAKKLRALRNYGSEVKYHHPELGFNSRLDALQAVVLSAKLARLEEWNAKRREAARRYDEMLAGLPEVVLPRTLAGNEHIWHLYVVRVPSRDEVMKRMQASGIGVGVHYPVPIHLQGAFAHLGCKRGDFPVAEKAAAQMLSLPMFAEITVEQQERVVAELKNALGQIRARG